MDKPKMASQRSRRRVVASLVVLVIVLAATSVLVQFRTIASRQSPLDRLARQFYRLDDQGLHWKYEAMLKAYQECHDSACQQQLLDLMIASRAAHLVPDIIDSISSGGSMDTERKIRTIIKLTGHDFSKEFDITSITQQSDADEIKTSLRGWWMENRQRIAEARRPKDTFHAPNDWPSLALTLATEKSQYLELEPIRLTATLKDQSDTWYTFRYRWPEPAFKLEFFRVVDGTVKISEVRYPDRWIICGNASRWFALPDYFVIDPNSSHVTQQWVNNGYEGCFEAGEVTLRAVLTPLHGKHKGRQLVSNDLRVEVVKPQGEDAAAHQFLTGTQVVDVGDGQKSRPELVRLNGLVWNSNSSHNNALDDYFIRTYGRSRYAYYVRYTQAAAARRHADASRNSYPANQTYSNAETVLITRLEEIVRDAPRDFPLLADAYVALLDFYKETGELQKMAEVSGTVELDALPIADPRLSVRLTALIEHPQVVVANVHRKDSLGRTSLHKAVENGPPALVLFLLANGADVNAHGNEETPLFVAAKAGRNKLIEVLLSCGADINAKSSGVTPLFWPIQDGRIDTVRLLLARGAEVNVTDNSGRTPFEWAVKHNRLEIARLLGEARGAGGKTPLHWAVEHGRRAMVHSLLKNGARIDVKDNAGRTPWDTTESQADKDSDAMAIFLLLKEYVQTK